MTDPVYARSPVTGNWYRVTDYEKAGEDGRIVANEKEEVPREEVPEDWQDAITEADD